MEFEDPKDKTEGGIFLPEQARIRPLKAVVLAVGPGRMMENGVICPMPVQEGDKILVSMSGHQLEGQGNKQVRIVSSPDVLAIFEEEE